jgi:diguanylate cyclase (GGDEF)-like protein
VQPWRLSALGGAGLVPAFVLCYEGIRHLPVDIYAMAVGVALTSVLVFARLSTALREIQAQASALAALADSDPLTGVANRRRWDAELETRCAEGRRSGEPLSVALLDLDHFKRYNDEHGHMAGDRLLKAVTAAWSAMLRPPDLLARLGGEEFGVLLPGCAATAAEAIAERLRAATPVATTVSVGVAQWDGEENVVAVLARADDALYAAKRRRNCVVVSASV